MKLVWTTAILFGAAVVAYAVWRQRHQRPRESSHLIKTMEQRADGSWSEPVLHADTSAFIGKHLVIAVRYPQGGKQALVHFYGPIARVSEEEGIVISRSGGLGDFAVPPRAFLVEEHRRETRPASMADAIRPDYSTLIALDGPPREQGWDRALDRHNAQ